MATGAHSRNQGYTVYGVFGAETVEVKQVLEGGSVTLNTGVTKGEHDKMLWYFNDTRIALISGHPSKSCLYDGEDGRFRDRLEVDYETGSLTIRDIRSEHAGRYEANFIQSKSSGPSESLNRNSKCDSTKILTKTSSIHDDIIKTFSVSVSVANPDKTIKAGSGLSSGAVAGIAVAVLLGFVASAVGVIYYRHRSFRKADVEKNNREFL
ncbi:hypothetical protein PO909_028277 [Leuciscus waleckii]